MKTNELKTQQGKGNLEKKDVDWNTIDNLSHNREYDGKQPVKVGEEVDWNIIDNIDHNKEVDKNN